MNKKNTKIIEITIDGDNEEYKRQIKYFLTSLFNANKEFCQKLETSEIEWNIIKDEFKNNHNKEYNDVYHYVPENIKNKSPITFFNGDWGSGKSKFFEELIKLTIENHKLLEDNKFEKIAVIDLWTYMNNENMIEDVLNDCFDIIFKKNNKILNKLWNKVKKSKINENNLCKTLGFLKLITKCIIGLINFKKIAKEDIFNATTPTILIFENLERLEIKSMEIVKLIQKLSVIKNIIVIFSVAKDKVYSMNKNNQIFQMDFDEEKNKFDNEEHWLNKYSTLGTQFNFNQEYITYIKNKKISGNDEIIKSKNEKVINTMFLKSNLNFRGLEDRMNFNKNYYTVQELFKKTKYHAFYFIEKHVLETPLDQMLSSFSNDLWHIKDEFDLYRVILNGNEYLQELYSDMMEFQNSNDFTNFFNNKNFCSFFAFFHFRKRFDEFIFYESSKDIDVKKIISKDEKENIVNKNKLFWIFNFLNINNFLDWVKKYIKEIINYIIDLTNINISGINDEDNFYLKEIEIILKIINVKYEFFISILNLMKQIIKEIQDHKNDLINQVEILNSKASESCIGLKEFQFLSKNIEQNMFESDFLKKVINIIENEIIYLENKKN